MAEDIVASVVAADPPPAEGVGDIPTQEADHTPSPETAPPSADGDHWYDKPITLDPKWRNMKWLQTQDSMDAVMQQMDGLQRVRGRSVILPESSDDPDFEAKAEAIYRRLGQPEKPDDYAFDMPEGAPINSTALDAFRAAAHHAGLNQRQVDLIYKAQLEAAQRNNDLISAECGRLVQEMQAKWSTPVYEAKRAAAVAFLDQFGIREPFEQTRLLYLDSVVDVLDRVHRICQSEGIMPQGSPAGRSFDDVDKEIGELKRSEAYRNASHPDFERTKRQVKGLEDIRAYTARSR